MASPLYRIPQAASSMYKKYGKNYGDGPFVSVPVFPCAKLPPSPGSRLLLQMPGLQMPVGHPSESPLPYKFPPLRWERLGLRIATILNCNSYCFSDHSIRRSVCFVRNAVQSLMESFARTAALRQEPQRVLLRTGRRRVPAIF